MGLASEDEFISEDLDCTNDNILNPWECKTCGIELAEKYVKIAKLLMGGLSDFRIRDLMASERYNEYRRIRAELPKIERNEKWN